MKIPEQSECGTLQRKKSRN